MALGRKGAQPHMNLMTSHVPAFPSPTVFFLNAISFKMNLQVQAYIPLKSGAEREKRTTQFSHTLVITKPSLLIFFIAK